MIFNPLGPRKSVLYAFLGIALGQGLSVTPLMAPFMKPFDTQHASSKLKMREGREMLRKKRKEVLSRIEFVFRRNIVLKPGGSPIDYPGLARVLLDECDRTHFEPALILALIEVESNFQTSIRSPRGAVGLMQLRPNTARDIYLRQKDRRGVDRELAEVLDLTNPELNLRLGIRYLGHLRSLPAGKGQFDMFASYLIGPEKYAQLKGQPGYRPRETLRYFQKIAQKTEHWRSEL